MALPARDRGAVPTGGHPVVLALPRTPCLLPPLPVLRRDLDETCERKQSFLAVWLRLLPILG